MRKVLPLVLLLLAVCTGLTKAADDVELKDYIVPGERISWDALKAGDKIVLQNAVGTWYNKATGTFQYSTCLYSDLEGVFLNGVQDKYNRTSDGQLDVTDTPLSSDNIYELVEAPAQHDGVNSYYLQHVDTKKYVTCCANPMSTALTDNIDDATSFEIESAMNNVNVSVHTQWTSTGLVDDASVVFVHFDVKEDADTGEKTETRNHFGPFWNYGYSYYGTAKDIVVWNAYEGTIHTDNSALINLKKLLAEISKNTSTFPIGDKPGYYPQEKVNTYETALLKAQDAIDMVDGEEAYLACFKELKPLYEDLLASMNPITDGYYYITSSYEKFQEERGVSPMLMGSKDGYVYWNDPQLDDPNYIFYVEKLESGNYNVKNFGLGKYIDKTYAKAQYVELRDEPSVEQIIASRGDGSFRMGNTEMNKRPYYPDANGYGKSLNGHLGQNSSSETWCGWNFEKVPQEIIDKLQAEVKQLALTQQLDNLLDPAITTYSSCFNYDIDKENPLLTQFSDDPAESQVTVNYKKNKEDEDNSIAYLNDNNYDTYLHTGGYNPTAAGATIIDGAFCIYADLGEKPVQKFVCKMSKRSGDYGQDERPTKLTVYARNNDTEVWTKIQKVELTGESNIIDAYSTGIDMGEAYRYVRFDIDDTFNPTPYYGKIYYSISEFQMYPAVLNEEYSQYAYAPGLKDACDALLTQMNHAREAVANNNATQEDYDKLNAAIEAVKPLIADTATIFGVVQNSNKYVETYGVGEDFGQVTDEQLAAYEQVVAAANNYDRKKPVKSDLDKRIESINTALAKFKSQQKTIKAGQWYYIANCDQTRTGKEDNIYDTKVFGNVIYSQTANTEDEKLESEVDEIWHGFYDRDTDVQDELANPATMWRAVALGDTAYAFQNRATGSYLGKFYSQSVGGGLSKKPVPYYLEFTGVGEFNIICADTLNVNKLPLHASGEGRLKVWAGGYNSASSWTFKEVEETGTVEYPFENNYISIVTLPFAQSNLNVINDGFKFYTIKNMPNETTLELSEIKEGTAIAAGQPFIAISGDYKAYDPESEDEVRLIVEAPNEFTTTAQTANGLVGVLYGDSLHKAGYGMFEDVKLTASTNDTFIDGMTGYINPLLIADAGGQADLTLEAAAPITSIRQLNTELANGTVNVYGIDGKLIKKNVKSSQAAKNLKKGVYIVGKKKIQIK